MNYKTFSSNKTLLPANDTFTYLEYLLLQFDIDLNHVVKNLTWSNRTI